MKLSISTTNQQKMLSVTRHQLALTGYEGISIRVLAKIVGIAPSVFYHYFSDKDSLLQEVYLSTNKRLAQLRTALPKLSNFEELLQQRIQFQFAHAEEISAILKYYLHFRSDFKKNSRGHLPEKTYLHIEEVLEFGEKDKIYSFPNLNHEAKIIVHTINGFILEYFPAQLGKKEELRLVHQISDFVLRALAPYRLERSSL